ncbi:MAG: hypothetical protein B7Z55_03065 [Planctomycetales bacterium 12-60-4]|nr:MAG: hypothetical protein B7Z55_03065 [Planctomycetales bacterium 12-60-4]
MDGFNMKPALSMSVAVRVAVFTAVIGLLGGLCAGVCYAISGVNGIEAAAWATALCLPPGWLVFLVEPLYRLPRQAIYGALVTSMVRLGVVTAGVLVIVKLRPDVPRIPFIGCLAVLYLSSLAIETRMLMRGLPMRAARGSAPKTTSETPVA